MAEQFAGATAPSGGWDAAVASAVNASAAANGTTVSAAYYTDICGIPLEADGTAALNVDNTDNLAVADKVGTGEPASSNNTPNCPSRVVGPPAGVLVFGHKDIRTYVVNVVGISSWSVTTQATAASGYLQESCSASQGDACALLPVTVPVNILSCDGSNNPVDTGNPWVADGTTVYKVPLCKNGPGNVGWLDWTPPGGVPDTIQSIIAPNNPAIPLPSWQAIASTGGPNDPKIESALRAYDGQVVLIPQFDLTCNPGPNGTPDSSKPAIDTAPNYGCPAGDLGIGGGTNQWYRLPSFAHFQLCISTDPACMAVGAAYGAYTNGNNKAACDTGNGATQCLVGKFVSIEDSGTIGAGFGGGTGNSKAVGVQLIR
jgi:hypothetical protein